MFGHNKKKAYAEHMAPQWMKILTDCRDLVNKTADPDVFFPRYDLLKETAASLASISKYVKFKGTKPAEVLRMAQEQEEAATRDFILRSFQRAVLGAEKAKTEKGKRSQFDRFQEKLEPYYCQMSAANADLVQQLHDEAIAKIGG